MTQTRGKSKKPFQKWHFSLFRRLKNFNNLFLEIEIYHLIRLFFILILWVTNGDFLYLGAWFGFGFWVSVNLRAPSIPKSTLKSQSLTHRESEVNQGQVEKCQDNTR